MIASLKFALPKLARWLRLIVTSDMFHDSRLGKQAASWF
jgi:hypothetical protein